MIAFVMTSATLFALGILHLAKPHLVMRIRRGRKTGYGYDKAAASALARIRIGGAAMVLLGLLFLAAAVSGQAAASEQAAGFMEGAE